jgi:hypothetical protein
MDLDAGKAMRIALGMLGVALLLRGSFLGWMLAGAAAVPAAYVMWIGAQEEGQRHYARGVGLLLASLGLAAILFLMWLFG